MKKTKTEKTEREAFQKGKTGVDATLIDQWIAKHYEGPLVSGCDFVIATRRVSASRLQSGDLVLVDISTPSGQARTIRRIEQHPDTRVGQFYLRSLKDDGIEARHFGPVSWQSIKGKVLWIWR